MYKPMFGGRYAHLGVLGTKKLVQNRKAHPHPQPFPSFFTDQISRGEGTPFLRANHSMTTHS